MTSLVLFFGKPGVTHSSRLSVQLVAFPEFGLDKGGLCASCEYQSCSKLLKLDFVKIWWHLAK
jgi:hypothetical protein